MKRDGKHAHLAMRAALPAALLLALAASGAQAQSVHEDQPLHVTVGSPAAASAALLPTSRLRAAWFARPTQNLESPPIVLPNGQLFVLTPTGDALIVDQEGKTLTTFSIGSRTSGRAARLADGTILVATPTGEAIGIRAGHARFRTRIFAETHGVPSVFALADGGAVVADGTELVALDGSGVARARVTLDESPAEPLLAVGDAIAVIGTSGAVHLWIPGSEPESVGTFGESTAGVVAIGRTLTAISAGRLLDLDTVQKTEHARSEPSHGAFIGQPMRIGDDVAALYRDGSHVELVEVARDGSERRRTAIAIVNTPVSDAGAPSSTGGGGPTGQPSRPGNRPPPPVTATSGLANEDDQSIADANGTVAFAIEQGPVGVVDRDGSVLTTSHPCALTASSGPRAVPASSAFVPRRGLTMLSAMTWSPPGTADPAADGRVSSAALLVSCSTGNLEELVSSQK